MNCLVCGETVDELQPSIDGDPALACWDGGLVEWVLAGYGSAHDGSRFLICLCDDCIAAKLADGLIGRSD